METQDNILFLRLRLLGDIIFTIPAIQLYKHHFPQSRIYYVAEEKFREIAALIPGVHKVIIIPRKMGIRQMWAFRRELKKVGFDTAVDFHSGPKSAQLTFISGAKRRIGYKTPNRDWAYNSLTPRTSGNSYTHSVYNQSKLLEHLDIPVDPGTLPDYPPLTIPVDQISGLLKDTLEQTEYSQKAVIHVGAGSDFRDWGVDKFSALTERLKEDKVEVFLVGSGKAEEERGAYLADRFNLRDFTGKLTIPEVLYLIAGSSVYMGADSGPLHLASLTPTPIVALYGPNLPAISGPWRKKDVTILEKSMECRPCDQRTCIYDIIPCMKTITTDEVYEAIDRYLK
ncbi:MAG: glycosyltransferase family 9 protein [bacterium]|nr:glycosyltransferase family 9 protein [bacterium]